MSKKNVLVVTTSNALFTGPNPHPTGVWMEEFAVPYMALLKAGIDLTVASPNGGEMPVDPRSKPSSAQEEAWRPAIDAARKTVKVSEIKAEDFDAIFIPGGHGPMFDLPNDVFLMKLLADFQRAGKYIGSVCHGPAGLVNARQANG